MLKFAKKFLAPSLNILYFTTICRRVRFGRGQWCNNQGRIHSILCFSLSFVACTELHILLCRLVVRDRICFYEQFLDASKVCSSIRPSVTPFNFRHRVASIGSGNSAPAHSRDSTLMFIPPCSLPDSLRPKLGGDVGSEKFALSSARASPTPLRTFMRRDGKLPSGKEDRPVVQTAKLIDCFIRFKNVFHILSHLILKPRAIWNWTPFFN